MKVSFDVVDGLGNHKGKPQERNVKVIPDVVHFGEFVA